MTDLSLAFESETPEVGQEIKILGYDQPSGIIAAIQNDDKNNITHIAIYFKGYQWYYNSYNGTKYAPAEFNIFRIGKDSIKERDTHAYQSSGLRYYAKAVQIMEFPARMKKEK